LEFWFLTHVKNIGKYYSECNQVGKELTKHELLKSYEKSEKYFVKNTPDIYKRLRPCLHTGIANAAKLGDFDASNPEQAKAELFKLFGLLGIVIENN
jgi:hypothetical protein